MNSIGSRPFFIYINRYTNRWHQALCLADTFKNEKYNEIYNNNRVKKQNAME